MRIAVLILAILGCGAAGFVAFGWFQELLDPELEQALANKKTRIKLSANKKLVSPEELEQDKDWVAFIESVKIPGYCLLAALPLGLAGGVVGFMRRGLIAGILLLMTVPGPIIFGLQAPSEVLIKVLVGVGPFVLAGVLAFFIKKKPLAVDEEPAVLSRRKVAVPDEA